MSKISPPHRLSPIEGLRGYLAMWVLVGHVFVFGAFIHMPDYFHGHLGGVLDILDQAGLAVNCFMMVSGFVIFMLIDRKREPYRIFILRRFLRIFPVYFFLFLLSMLMQCLDNAGLPLTHGFQSADTIANVQHANDGAWHNVWIHVLLHLVMLHGMVPVNILPNSATAFLGAAWSLSLEWQFYLVAPLLFALFLSKVPWHRIALFALCLIFILKGRYFFSNIQMGAVLPARLIFFLTGIVSYFIYDAVGERTKVRGDFTFPLLFLMMVGLYVSLERPMGMIPFLIWCVVFGILLEPKESLSRRLIGPIFTNPVSLWLGQISYSVYLSHSLFLASVQFLVLKLIPLATQGELLWILLLSVPTLTLIFSTLLYRVIEAPFIEMGKNYGRKLSHADTRAMQVEKH